ncbi:MAG: murein biosynthesis integral membrane protein MurJ [Acidobacteria bacterium RIFCSPLOWO2_12_FULL_60_22]|nr:MAG: murein biosynthesis integral membrane protein MurJ [Acidobacteria bacterium RIFCSPLOWO2_12_FULL_60_22]
MVNTPAPDFPPTASATQRRQLFLRSAAIVAASVFLSRVLGFLREWAIAHQVGSNAVTDAYYAAFTIPDILNYLLAGGALSITFLPVFLEYYTSRREEEAWHLFSSVLTAMTVLLLGLVVVAEVYAPVLTRWIAPGFTPEQHQIVTHLTRIMLPAQAFFFIGGVLSAVQYAQGRFLIPSLAPLIYNGMIIGSGILLAGRIGIQAFSWGVLGGSLLGNCLLQVYGVRRLSARFRVCFDFSHPGMRRFFRLTVPIMLGFSLIFVDDWAIRWCGSFLVPASITWLGYGKILMRVVVAVFGQAAGVASYPILARLAAEKKWEEMKEGLEDALRHVIVTIVPISALMAILSRQIVFLLFSRTRLEVYDIEQTALAMTIFLVGAVAWGTQAILGRGFYALGDTLTPTLIGSGLALAWLPVYWYASQQFQHLGLAAASSLGVLLYTAVLWVVLFRRLRIPLARLGGFFLWTAASAGLAAGVAFYFERWLERHLNWQTLTGSFLQAAAASLVFLLSFGVFASLLRIASWREVRGAFGGKGN